ncbi:hypothetical protein K488DRAFT_72633 [Vararia minispora EC-137]|uniref:Uncharacterized protein n=1 Tax=Vararia minispora EC-137 TaxID=1314806 RepID=A0ACB8QF18_9AGAM|nr:hypothetical protein K488DRAFT_72633 [Vararia minispora EC-137]
MADVKPPQFGQQQEPLGGQRGQQDILDVSTPGSDAGTTSADSHDDQQSTSRISMPSRKKTRAGGLVKDVKPLLEEAEKVLNETNGAVRGADPDNHLSNRAKRHVKEHAP